MDKKNKKTGLALSGGAARGYAHIPIIQKLIKENVKINMISGSSAGALVGAYFALHGEVDSLVKKVENIEATKWLSSIFNKKKFIEKFLKELYGDSEFKDTRTKLIIVATDAITGKPIYFDSGKITDIVYYSLTMPGIIPAKSFGETVLIDGDMSDRLPIKILEENKIDKIIAVDLLKNLTTDIDLLKAKPTILFQHVFMKIIMLCDKDTEHNEDIFTFSPESNIHLGEKKWLFRFDLISEHMKPGEEIVKKEWGNFEKWLKK